MKRLLIVLGVVAFLGVLPLSHLVMACECCEGKVALCHVNSANDTYDSVVFGRVIEVDENAVSAHLEEHGDSLCYFTLTEEEREALELEFDIRLPNANCYFCAPVDGV